MTRGRGGRAKRERSTSVVPTPLPKRLRRPSLAGDPPPVASAAPSHVVVTGLPSDCSVLELKSRLGQFGSVSRIKINSSGSGDVTFRSDAAAQAAILASLDPDLGISIGSCKVGYGICFFCSILGKKRRGIWMPIQA
jgi:RNA recognition motif. (a.k.a. RRM, RBD, or RNP domain)